MSDRAPELRVECYAGHRGDETPRRFVLEGRRVEVVEVAAAWLEPDERCFRVRGDDGSSYELRQEAGGGEWRLAGGGGRSEVDRPRRGP